MFGLWDIQNQNSSTKLLESLWISCKSDCWSAPPVPKNKQKQIWFFSNLAQHVDRLISCNLAKQLLLLFCFTLLLSKQWSYRVTPIAWYPYFGPRIDPEKESWSKHPKYVEWIILIVNFRTVSMKRFLN